MFSWPPDGGNVYAIKLFKRSYQREVPKTFITWYNLKIFDRRWKIFFTFWEGFPILRSSISHLLDQNRDGFWAKNIRIAIEKVAVLKNDTIVIVQLVSLIASGPIESILTIQNKSKVTEVLCQTLFSIWSKYFLPYFGTDFRPSDRRSDRSRSR